MHNILCFKKHTFLYMYFIYTLYDNVVIFTVKLLEYDERFAVFGNDYVYYNFNNPLDVSKELDKFDIVLMDPPFLSKDCLTKSAITAKFLAKDKIILCTGWFHIVASQGNSGISHNCYNFCNILMYLDH